MIPKPRFEIGQRVICVRVSWTAEERACPDCLGETRWRVLAPSGESWDVPCNTCSAGFYSTGKVSSYDDRVIKERMTIGSVQIDTARQEGPVRYMCFETGIGNGTVWEESCLFATEEEADAYGDAELARVKGARQAKELARRKRKKTDRVYKR